MKRTKRNTVIAGIVLGLGAAALGFLGSPAQAGHIGCTDDSPTQEIGTQISPAGSPVYLSSVVYPGGSGTYYGVGVCYGLPLGIASGNVIVQAYPERDSTGDYSVRGNPRCEAHPGVVTLGCSTTYLFDTTDDGDWGTVGKATDAQASAGAAGANVGSTGAYVAEAEAPTDLPNDGDSTTAAGADARDGTCVWVNGAEVRCTENATVAGITVNEADLVKRNTPGTGCWLGTGSTCAVQNTGIGIGRDSTNPTVEGTVAGNNVPPVDAPRECVRLGADC